MIKYNTNGSNASDFKVNFDFSPSDVNSHKAAGRKDRHGIWEGIELAEAWYRIDGGAWQSIGKAYNYTVTVKKNGAKIEGCARYVISTMGLPKRSYPYMYFGKLSGGQYMYKDNSEKWTKYFKNAPIWPNHVYSECDLDSSWSKHYIGWASPGADQVTHNWCYKNSLQKNPGQKYKTEWRGNVVEYRNGNYSDGGGGWTSVQGNKPQEYRRNLFFQFKKDYYTSAITSTGIAEHPNTPQITVHWAHGDNGKVTVKYSDPRGFNGRIQLQGKCGNKEVTIDSYESSGHWGSGGEWTYDVNFNHFFGEGCRGHDVYYSAKCKNDHGYESHWTGWTGRHRYNARPTTPTNANLTLNGNTLTASWNASSDSDVDGISYCVYFYQLLDGQWSHCGTNEQDNGHWTNTTSYTTNISWADEGRKFMVKVWAWDGRIYSSSFSQSNEVMKGYSAATPSIIYPKSDIFSGRPRIVIDVKGNPGQTNNMTQVYWKNTWYNNKDNSDLFSLHYNDHKTKFNHRIVFCPPHSNNLGIGSTTVKVKVNNGFTTSNETSKAIKRIDVPTIANKQDFINSSHLNNIVSLITKQGLAYDIEVKKLVNVLCGDDYENINADCNDCDIDLNVKAELFTHIESNTYILADNVNSVIDDIYKLNSKINDFGYTLNIINVDKVNRKDYITANTLNNIAYALIDI